VDTSWVNTHTQERHNSANNKSVIPLLARLTSLNLTRYHPQRCQLRGLDNPAGRTTANGAPINGAGPGIKEAKRVKERIKEDHPLTLGGMKAVVTNGQVTSTPKRKQDGQTMMIRDGIHQAPMRSKNKKVVKKRRTKEKVPKRRKMNVLALDTEKHRLSLTGMPTDKDGTKEKIVERGSTKPGSRRRKNKMLPTGRLINLST